MSRRQTAADFPPGTRVRGYGQQYPDALRFGTMTVEAATDRRDWVDLRLRRDDGSTIVLDNENVVIVHGRELIAEECAAIVGVRTPTWHSYVHGRRPKHTPPPLPARHVGRTPLWDEVAVRAWALARPGRGARFDLRT